MTWIKTVRPDQADAPLRDAVMAQRALYPPEYAGAVPSAEPREEEDPSTGILLSHSLIPEALRHAFSTLGSLLSPTLPLSRRQHEMIAATVSALNRCHY